MQPLVPQAPQVSQRTSWMSCCGLFDLFTGSNRWFQVRNIPSIYMHQIPTFLFCLPDLFMWQSISWIGWFRYPYSLPELLSSHYQVQVGHLPKATLFVHLFFSSLWLVMVAMNCQNEVALLGSCILLICSEIDWSTCIFFLLISIYYVINMLQNHLSSKRLMFWIFVICIGRRWTKKNYASALRSSYSFLIMCFFQITCSFSIYHGLRINLLQPFHDEICGYLYFSVAKK